MTRPPPLPSSPAISPSSRHDWLDDHGVAPAMFIAVALAILVLAKVMLWVLIGTAPIFISCMLFEQTRSYGVGWFNQVAASTR